MWEIQVDEIAAPEVSIVIPAYNYGRFLGQAIESVLSQGLCCMEVVVLDNASADDTPEVVGRYRNDPRVRYLRHSKNIGGGPNWNRAIREARGKFVALLCADDYFLPGHLKTLVAELRANPDCDVAYVPILRVDETGRVLRRETHPGYAPRSYRGERDEFPLLLSCDCYITPSAALMRRSALPDGDAFDSALRGAGDWDFWVRLARKNPRFIFVNEPTVAYRIHGGQDSVDFYSTTHPLTDHLMILERSLASPERDRLKGASDAIWNLLLIR
ncbi:MAG: glycosyltransferase, partial [bacterium]|nr:glycosyltransferase [bacterium]